MTETPHPDPSAAAFVWLRGVIADPLRDNLDPTTIWAHVDDLSGLDRARLLGPLWGPHLACNPGDIPWALASVIDALESAPSDSRGTAPIFDSAAADVALAGLAANIDRRPPDHFFREVPGLRTTPRQRWHGRLGHLAALVLRRLVAEPGPEGRGALAALLAEDVVADPLALALAAHLAGDAARETAARAKIAGEADSALARAEITALFTAHPLRWPALFADHGLASSVSVGAALADDPGDLPAWRAFAETAVAEALAQVRAVQSGAVPYTADKLMPPGAARAVGRAMRLALAEGLDWGVAALPEIWRGAAHAPDPKAKTVPSQPLTYALAKAVIDEPRPAALACLQEIAGSVRHAAVKKKLEKMVKSARSALQDRPDLVLDMALTGGLPADLRRYLKPALEGLLLRDWAMDQPTWAAQMIHPDLRAATHALIWDITEGADRFSALPNPSGTAWTLADGRTRPMAQDQRILLWHPADWPEPERADWRARIAGAGPQPFTQAFREVYDLPEAELAGRRTEVFAGIGVAQIPAFGVARRSGFTSGYRDALLLTLGGQRFVFHSGVRNYPGAGGEGFTGAVDLLGPARTLGDVAPRVLNEALRRIDLVVATGAAGVTDSEAILHPDTFRTLWPGAQSVAMRQALLELTRPAARFDGRWLLLGEGARIHLGTGRLDRDGTPLDLPKVARGATARSDDGVMDRIWAAIGTFGLG